MTIGIYKITNKVNGKSYIGQSVNIEKRWTSHRNSQLETPLYKSFRKHGINNFSFEILKECSREELNELEIMYINKFKTTNALFGYNLTSGGDSAIPVETQARHEEIKRLLSETELDQKDIAEMFNIHFQTVSDINRGIIGFDDFTKYPIRERQPKEFKCLDCGKEITFNSKRCIECANVKRGIDQRIVKDRPSKEWLIENIATRGFEDVAREFGVTGNSIRKWCVSYGLPTLIKDVKILYGNYIEKPSKQKIFKYSKIEVVKGESFMVFEDITEMADYIKSNNLSNASYTSIKIGVRRLVSGDRNSYLGFRLVNSSKTDLN